VWIMPETRINELIVFNVAVTAPDPLSAWVITIPVKNKDLLAAKGFIEEFKRFRQQLDEKWNDEIKQRFELRRVESKMTERATIVHQGRGARARIYIMMYPLPQAMYNVANNAKYKIYTWLWGNAIVIGKKPQNLYLITQDDLPTLSRKIEEANRIIGRANDLATRIYETEVKNVVKQLLEKYHYFGEEADKIEKLLNIKQLHPIYAKTYPIVFSQLLISRIMQRSPEAAEIVSETFKSFITEVLKDVHNKLKPIVEQLILQRSVRRDKALQKVDRVTDRLKKIGLEAIADQVRALYVDLIQNPWKARQYANWDEFVRDVNTRLLSL